MSSAGLSGRSEIVDTVDRCREVVAILRGKTEIAVDMEGVNHGRHGQLSLVQACAGRDETVYLFDITKLKKSAFDDGNLRALFEDSRVCKVMFDVRSDADSLFHNYSCRLENAYDLQVLHCFKFSEITDSYLKGLAKVLQDFSGISLAEKRILEQLKALGTQTFTSDSVAWERRPLPQSLRDYAAVDVRYLQEMKRAWGGVRYDETVLRVSRERVRKQIMAAHPVEGREKARREFGLEGFGVQPAPEDDDYVYDNGIHYTDYNDDYEYYNDVRYPMHDYDDDEEQSTYVHDAIDYSDPELTF